MKKNLQLLMIAIVVLMVSVGCSAPVNEIAEESVSEESVALEPEESGITAPAEKVIAENNFPEFQLKMLDEEEVTEALFAEYELTLVNIWGTTCTPCISEMPELEKLQATYEEKGLKVVGIVIDGNYLAAKEITDALLVTYDHIIPDEAFAKGYLSKFQFIPTTLFVDKNGVILGEPMVGAYDFETFEAKVKEYLGIE